MLKDKVFITDNLIINGREFGNEKSVVETKGWVKLFLRENGKIVPGSHREGHNIWTNSGREYSALLMSLTGAVSPSSPVYRTDSIAYIGVGIGTQIEQVGVLALANPVVITTGVYLAALDVPPSFPLMPSRTTVQFHHLFQTFDITTSSATVNISELGLFTNGDPTLNYAPGSRNTSSVPAAPQAYKTFEPVAKTNALELDVSWQIRF